MSVIPTDAPTSPRARFLTGIPESVRSHLQRWPPDFGGQPPTVLISPVRKATCLLDALLRLDLWTPDYDFTSSLVLDMPGDWIRGADVVLADDAVFTGRTIREVTRQLREGGASSVRLCPLAVSSSCPDLGLELLGEPLVLSEDRLAALSILFVESLGLLPRPYNVDWPLTREIAIAPGDLGRLNSMVGWTSTSLSSRQQRAVGVSTYTLHPDATIVASALADLPPFVIDALTLPKIRLYVQNDPAQQSLGVSALSVAYLSGATTAQLSEAVDWASARAGLSSIKGLFADPRAALRLLQYVVGVRLLDAWAASAGLRITDHPLPYELDRRQLRYSFSPPSLADVARCLDSVSASSASLKVGDLLKGDAPPTRVEPTRERLDEVDLRESIRLRADRRLADLAKEENLSRTADDKVPTRGLNLDDLLPEIVDTDDAQLRLFASLYLDSAIDSGTAVPAVSVDGDIVLRQLRPGETVRLTERVFRYAEVMLRSYIEASGRTTIPKITLQKLLVLLVRLGDRRGYFPPNPGPYGANGTVGVRFALHGAVLSVAEQSPFGRSDRTIADELLDATVIDEGRRGYLVASGPAIFPAAEGNHEGDVAAVGALLGELHSAGDDRQLTDWDLVVLATLPSSLDQGYALAAEAEIICRGLPSFFAGTRSKDLIEQLRSERRGWHTAINNAAKKSECILNREYERLQVEIAQSLGPVHRGVWQSLVEAISSPGSSGDSERYLTRCVRWISAVYALIEGRDAILLGVSLDQLDERERRKRLDGLAERWTRARHLLGNFEPDRSRRASTRWKAVSEIQALVRRLSAVDLSVEANLDPATSPLRQWALEEAGRGSLAELERTFETGLLKAGNSLVDEAVSRFDSAGFPRDVLRLGVTAILVDVGEDDWDVVRRLQVEASRAKRREGPAAYVADGFIRGCATTAFAGPGSTAEAAAWLRRAAAELGSAKFKAVLFHGLPDDYDLYMAVGESSVRGGTVAQTFNLLIEGQVGPGPGQVVEVTWPANSAESQLTQSDDSSARRREATFSKVGSGTLDGLDLAKYEVSTEGRVETKSEVDVALVAVVPEAVKELQERFGLASAADAKVDAASGRFFYESLDGQPRKMVLTQTTEQGNQSIKNALEDLFSEYSPRLVCVVDICGGIHDSVSLGDVVLATEVLYYDRRKDTPDGTHHRGSSLRPGVRIANTYRAFEVGHDPIQAGYSVHEGLVGSGEAVVASELSEIRAYLHSVNDQCLAVDMESGGAANTIYERGRRFDVSEFVFIRGCSDHANHKKDDSMRVKSLSNAGEALENVLGLMGWLKSADEEAAKD